MYQQHKEASLILAQLLYGDSNADIRKLAAETIRIRNTEHMSSFLKAAQNDKDESVRSAAILY